MSKLRLDIQLKDAPAQNQIVATDSSGKLQFISAPTADGQALVRASGVLAWQQITGSSYIGDATTHTAGGALDMNNFNISNVGTITADIVSIADTGGDLSTWTIQENASNQFVIGNPTVSYLSINSNSGQLNLPEYGSGSISGTIAYYLAIDSTGAVIEASPAGGGGNTVYSGDDVLTANRIVHLTDSIATPVAKRTLTFQGINNDIVFDDGVITTTGITFNVAATDNLSITEEETTGTSRIQFKKGSSNLMRIEKSGRIQFHNYTGTNFSGTVSKILTVDSSGIMLTTQPEINLLADVDATSPSDGDILMYSSGSGNWESIAPPVITFDVAAGADPTVTLGGTIPLATMTQVSGSIWNIYFSQTTAEDWATTITTGVKSHGAIIVPAGLASYSITNYGIVTNATGAGQNVTTVLKKNGAATTGSSSLTTPSSAGAGHLANTLTLGTPESVNGGDIIELEVTGVTGNPEGLVFYLEFRR